MEVDFGWGVCWAVVGWWWGDGGVVVGGGGVQTQFRVKPN